MDYSLVVQAGGESSRMGEDKGLILFQGVPLIKYILDQVKDLGSEKLIITNNQEAYERFQLPVFEDVIPGLGALSGLYSAIYHSNFDYSLVLACDMPFINLGLLDFMLSFAPEYDAVIPRLKSKEYAEPFRAIYSKSCLEPIRRNLEEGNQRVSKFLEEINVRFISSEEIRTHDPELRTFINLNTREDVIRAGVLAKKL